MYSNKVSTSLLLEIRPFFEPYINTKYSVRRTICCMTNRGDGGGVGVGLLVAGFAEHTWIYLHRGLQRKNIYACSLPEEHFLMYSAFWDFCSPTTRPKQPNLFPRLSQNLKYMNFISKFYWYLIYAFASHLI